MNEKVCIIGIGNNGKDCYKRLCGKYSEIYLYDNDRRKWNHDVFGNRIISIEVKLNKKGYSICKNCDPDLATSFQ